MECVKCHSKNCKEISNSDGSDDMDGLKHSRMICNDCGRQFNVWNSTKEEVKKVFGDVVKIYDNR
jgi:transposase-like protein